MVEGGEKMTDNLAIGILEKIKNYPVMHSEEREALDRGIEAINAQKRLYQIIMDTIQIEEENNK